MLAPWILVLVVASSGIEAKVIASFSSEKACMAEARRLRDDVENRVTTRVSTMCIKVQ